MKLVAVTTGFVLLVVCTKSHAQSAGVTPAVDAAPASQTSCVILKRMGGISRTESRLTHFGVSGKQFRYVEGRLPEGFSSRKKMNENNVRNLQARGAQVLVLESHYTSEDLQEARADCQRGSGKAASQVEARVSPAPAPVSNASAPTAKPPAPSTGATASSPAPATKLPAAKPAAPESEDSASAGDTTVAALLNVSSTPAEADVYIDDHLAGRTPSTLILMPGNHTVAIKKSGFVVWQRKLKLGSGRVNLDADLVPKAK
ncbi:MAG TPA: PEGA domain-containing protein [Candidatus Acidoferrum sp.]|nr:PEGA domain-containing protein [Candidatus Acidoferrum sp.]